MTVRSAEPRRAAGRRRTAASAGLLLAVLAVGCSNTTPPIAPAAPALPSQFNEPGPWAPAQPADALPRGAWWTVYGDSELDALQQRLLAASPDLAAALARYEQARAASTQLEAAQSPTVNSTLALQRNQQSRRRPLRVLGPNSPDLYSSDTLGLDIGYELDLWGRVRQQVDAGRAAEQAALADLASVRLVLQAQLTDSLWQLRGLDRDAALLRETSAALARSLALAQQRHDAGLASGLDVARAQAQLAAVRSQQQQAQGQRALVAHSIAALVGDVAQPLALPAAPRAPAAVLAVPVGLPSALLQRRPDVAGAERRVAAAHASVGVARTAFFPTVTLGAQGGFQTSDIGQFLRAPNLFWTLGPSLAVNLFNGGRRQAEVQRLQAVADEAGARYKAVVLSAFQQVEDNLALLRQYGEALGEEAVGVAAAQRALALAEARYREGAASQLEVLVAQTTLLQAQRSAQDLATRQQRAHVQLIRALGGGWQADEPTAASAR